MTDEKENSYPKNNWHKENHCPYCNHYLPNAFAPGNEEWVPSEGDVTCCIRCAEVSAFDENLKLKKVDISEYPLEVARSCHVLQIAIKEANRRMKDKC